MNSSARCTAGLVATNADVAEQLQHAAGDVAQVGIEHRVVIGERHVFEPALGDVLVEGRPAAVAALEAQQPIAAHAGTVSLRPSSVVRSEPGAAPSAPSSCRRCRDRTRC